MQLSNNPTKIQLPFATSGSKNVIPVPSQIPVTPGAASWTDGFPPLTMTPVIAGGIPPSGLDMNGVLNMLSAVSLWFNAGAAFQYDAAFSTAIGGYPKGARLLNAAGTGYWLNSTDNNENNPDTYGPGSGWLPDSISAIASVYASGQQTLASGISKVLFDTLVTDRVGLWDASNKRFTAPYAGLYRVSGAVLLIAPGGQQLISQILKNGALAAQCFEAPQVSTANMTLPYEAIISCNPGDYLELYMYTSLFSVTAGVTGSNQTYVFANCQFLG